MIEPSPDATTAPTQGFGAVFVRTSAAAAMAARMAAESRRHRARSEAVVGEGLVGLGHLLHVVALLDGGAEAVGGVISSAARHSAIVFSRRARAKSTIQRMASVVERRGRTSTGTW